MYRLAMTGERGDPLAAPSVQRTCLGTENRLTVDMYVQYMHLTCYLLTLGVHVPQGYTSWVCLCVSSLISPYSNESAKKIYELSQRCNRLIESVFFVKQPLCKTTKFASKLLAH